MWIWSNALYIWYYAYLITYLAYRLFYLYNNCDITFLTVFILTHPVNFTCGRKPEHPEKTFGRRLTDSFTWVRSENRTHDLRGACSYDCAAEAPLPVNKVRIAIKLFARRHLESRWRDSSLTLEWVGCKNQSGTTSTTWKSGAALRCRNWYDHFICKHGPYPVWFLRRYARYPVLQCKRIQPMLHHGLSKGGKMAVKLIRITI
jgi:hypothetical protein